MLSSCHAHPAAPLLLLLLLIVVLMRCPQRHTELSAGLGSVSHTHTMQRCGPIQLPGAVWPCGFRLSHRAGLFRRRITKSAVDGARQRCGCRHGLFGFWAPRRGGLWDRCGLAAVERQSRVRVKVDKTSPLSTESNKLSTYGGSD